MKKRIFLIISFCCTVFTLHSQPCVVPDSWCKNTGADGRCSLSAGLRSSTKPTVSVIAVYSARKSEETPENVFVMRVGGRDCGVLQYRQGQQETKTSSLTLHSTTTMLGNKSGILNVESNDSADIQEMMLYKRRLSDLERQKAETYLAIKHDITISEYVSEAGDTLWDNGDGQTRRIFGMAHDSTLGLYKTACGDVEGLTIEAADSLKAGDYLLCGERSGLPGGRVWRIEREGLAGETVIVKVGRNGQWREQEPVAILTEERNGITTETQLEAADKDESHYYFSVRFGEGKRSTYEFALSARDTQSNPSADTPREKSHKSSEGTSPATASDTGWTVELYPNPASDFVVIKGLEGEKKEVEIINAVGLTCKKAGLGENEQSVDIHALMSGNYIVVVRGGDNEYRVKLIKK